MSRWVFQGAAKPSLSLYGTALSLPRGADHGGDLRVRDPRALPAGEDGENRP